MKRTKRILAVILSLLMIISSLPLNAFADEEYYESDASGYCDNFYWTYTKETDTVYINITEQNEEGYISGNSDTGWLPLYETQADLESGEVYPFGIIENSEFCAFKNVVVGKDVKGFDNVYFSDYSFPFLETVVFEEGTQLEQIDIGLFSSTAIKSLEIPSSVKRIEAEAFSASKIENLILPEGLEYIGEQAFMDCNLGDLVIPSTVEWIYYSAFQQAGLTSVSFAEGSAISKIEGYAFEYNEKLTSVTIPANDISFGYEVFADCDKLETVVFEDDIVDGVPTGVIKIGDYMFQGCPVLQNVKFPKTLETIGQYAFCYAFSDNEEMVTLDLSNTSLKKVDAHAFSYTNMLDTVIFPDCFSSFYKYVFFRSSITSIDLSNTSLEELSQSLFRECKNLKSVELPDSLWIINPYAFEESGIESIELPEDLLEIGTAAFSKTYSLKNIDFPSVLEDIGPDAFEYSGITEIDLSECTNELYVRSYAFQETRSLETIYFPKANFTELSAGVLYHSAVKNVDIPCVTTISQKAFCNADRIKSISIPVGCTRIISNAFADCPMLSELYLPYTVNSVSGTIVGGSTSLTKLVYSGAYDISKYLSYDSIKNATVYGLTGSPLDDYCYDKSIKFVSTDSSEIEKDPDVEVINGTWSGGKWTITSVGRSTLTITGEGDLTNKCFDENGNETRFVTIIAKYNIDCVSIEEGITSIPKEFAYGNNIYYGSPSISIVRLPSTLKAIGDYAFSHNKLSYVVLPENLTSIGASAFDNNNITEFNANASLSFIGRDAFCNNPITSIDLGNVKTISANAFASTSIKSLTIGEKVQKIESGAFSYIPTLTTINLSNATGITRIENNTFYSAGIKSITIPKNVTYIGSAAFGNCTSLTSVKVLNYNVEIYGTDAVAQNAFGFDANGVKQTLTFTGAFGSTAYDYAKKYGFSFKAEFGDYEYCGIINQTTSNIYAKPLNWYYDPDKKTLYVLGDGYFNQNILRTSNGEEFTQKLDIDTISVEKGVYQVTTNLDVFNPKNIIFPEGLDVIGRDTLHNLTRLTQIKIPNTVISMYAESFKGCKNLKYIEFGKYIEDGVCKGLTSLEFVSFGNATRIGSRAFEGCTNLQEIVIPDTVTTIEHDAFNKCTAVQEIHIGKNATRIGYYAFARLPLCDKVTFDMPTVPSFTTNLFENSGTSTTGMELVFTDNVKSVDMKIVLDVNVSKVALGKNVSSFTNSYQIPTIKNISVDEENTSYYTYNSCLYNSDKTLVYAPRGFDRVDIQDGTKTIGIGAFADSSISTVSIPNSVETIDDKAFYKADRLKNVVFGNSVQSIGNSAFEGCVLLKIVSIPSSVKSIGNKAFFDCKILASVLLSEGLQKINDNAFGRCSALAGIVIPESVTYLGSAAFAGCSELKELYIWRSALGNQAFFNASKINVYTMAGSPAYEYCRQYNVPYNAYTDEECFYDECAMKLDVLAGYLGFCSDGHGDIQWLSVYDADCENDGYIIGVCEYCSEILDEKHIDASGHNYVVKTVIPPTQSTRGVTQYECTNCNSKYCEYTEATGSGAIVETHSVSGNVVISTNNTATQGVTPAKNASIVIDGITAATTNEKGHFELTLTTGVYEAEIRYTYGFTRTIYIVVEDEDISYKEPIAIIGCDFNKDGKIDNEDLNLFQYVVSATKDDPSYLAFVDMNNDGYINAKDRAYINSCKGLNAQTFEYEEVIIQK